MSRGEIPLYIFDWSGVISDDRRPVYEANMRLLESYGKPRITFEQWLPRTTVSPREFLANHGVVGEPDELFEKYRRELDGVRKFGIHPVIYPNTGSALRGLLEGGKILVVVSAHPEKNLRNEAEEYGIEKFFKFFVGNSEDKTRAILDACRGLSIFPSARSATYIGDTIYDIQAAKKAGVYSIGVTTGYHIRERLLAEKPDELIDSLSQLLG